VPRKAADLLRRQEGALRVEFLCQQLQLLQEQRKVAPSVEPPGAANPPGILRGGWGSEG